MKKTLPGDVYERFKKALVDGGATSDEDQEAISKALYAWARERGATDYAHWFFPMRGGSGATGGMLGALKCDAFIDLDWSSDAANKPFKTLFPSGRLLCRNQPVRRVHAIEQASRRWRGGRRGDSARTRRNILISTQYLTTFGM